MSVKKILIVDDEPGILNLVSAYLRPEGYEVYTAQDGPSGLKAARSLKPDLIVLDIMLPGIEGLDLLTILRQETDVFIILLTARTEESDKILGLSSGADDYVTKPFSPRELVARIKAALRRVNAEGGAPAPAALVFHHLRIDPASRQAWVDKRAIDLTAIEFDLLWTLAQHPKMVLSREQLLEKVWGYDYYGDTRVVDVHVGHIRQKLGLDNLITTVRGIGYRFEDKG
ncbi:MAG: response regulator transcription factor [Chloroflexi bacterium]|nr:response regulator transcription factor [Chloroflexota bacterium]